MREVFFLVMTTTGEAENSAPVVVYPGIDEPDLVRGTRIAVQCLPPPLNGRSGKIVDYDRASQAYVVHVDGGNPRTLYRENLRILEDQSVPVMPVKRATGRPQGPRSGPLRQPSGEMGSVSHHYGTGSGGGGGGGQIKPGDQILLCVEQFQFTLMEVTGIRKVCKSEPCSYAIAAILDDADIPGWMKRPPPVAARPPSSRTGTGPKVPGFRVGDPIYAVWDQDGRWYPGRIREDLGDKVEIEWSDKEAELSVVKKSLVCRRTSFDDLRNRPSYLGALNLASRTGGMKGLLKNGGAGIAGNASAEYDEEELETLQRIKEEESKRKATIASEQLFGPTASSNDAMSAEEWSTVLNAMKIMNKFGIDGLVSTTRGEVFHVPPKFPKDEPVVTTPTTKTEKTAVGDETVWDMEASSLLHAWIMQGKEGMQSTAAPPAVHPAPPVVACSSLVAPSRAILEASLSRALRKPVALPRGPLDIFRPPK